MHNLRSLKNNFSVIKLINNFFYKTHLVTSFRILWLTMMRIQDIQPVFLYSDPWSCALIFYARMTQSAFITVWFLYYINNMNELACKPQIHNYQITSWQKISSNGFYVSIEILLLLFLNWSNWLYIYLANREAGGGRRRRRRRRRCDRRRSTT